MDEQKAHGHAYLETLPNNERARYLGSIKGALAHDKYMSQKFEFSRRRENLSWSHHASKERLEHAIRCGQLLIEQKEQKARLEHGDWMGWVAEHCKFNERMARNYMQIFSNRQRVADFDNTTSLRGALQLLAEPKEKKYEPTQEPKQIAFSITKNEARIQEIRFWIRFLIFRDGPPKNHPIDELLEYFKREQP
jgi:hypothetical protein